MRVDHALDLTTLAHNCESKSVSLSFGLVEASAPILIERTFRIENPSRTGRIYRVTPGFRCAEQAGVRRLPDARGRRREADHALARAPRKAAETRAEPSPRGNPGPSLKLRNHGAEVLASEVFSLTGQSTCVPKSDIVGAGSN